MWCGLDPKSAISKGRFLRTDVTSSLAPGGNSVSRTGNDQRKKFLTGTVPASERQELTHAHYSLSAHKPLAEEGRCGDLRASLRLEKFVDL